MPVEISDELITNYLNYYTDCEKYKIPGRDPEEYNVADNFFNNIHHARDGLEQLLSTLKFPEPENGLEQDVYAEFTVTSHAKVREAPGQDDSVKLLVGQSAMMLEKSKEGKGSAIEQSKYADPNAIVFSSDLPRVIHYALLKYRPELEEKLDRIADDVQKEMQDSRGVIDRERYLQLVRLALKNGIISTPLLRSHYHGPRDLHPEKWEQFDIDSFLKTLLGKELYNGKDEREVRRLLEELKNLAKTGRAPFQLVEEGGRPLTENLPLYTFRVAYLVELFSPGGKFYDKIKGRKVNFIGHSSNIDILSSYFRHFENGKVVLEKADKSKTRGKELVIKVDSNFHYLNDLQKLEPLKEKSRNQIGDIRKLSIDTLIREGGGIVETPLSGFREKEERRDQYEPYSEKLETALDSNLPVIIFGHGGQGKSILAVRIGEGFLKQEFESKYGNIVPIIENCADLNVNLKPFLQSGDESLQKGTDYIYKYLKNQVEGGLHPLLLNEFKSVFIIDDYQKLNPDYTKAMEEAAHKLKSEGNLVILLSRMERTDVHPPHNPGYKTMQIDTEEIARETDDFIGSRIPSEHADRFKEYLEQYDSSVTGYYLTKLFLTMIFPGNSENKGVLEYIIDPSISRAIRDGKPLTRTQLYEAQTDYVTGRDIERLKPDWGRDKIRKEIVEWKNQLAKMAYEGVFGSVKGK